MALDFAAGCVGGAAGVLVGHPFDTVKVGVCCILFAVCSLVTKNKKYKKMQYFADSLNLNPDKLRVHNEPIRGMG